MPIDKICFEIPTSCDTCYVLQIGNCPQVDINITTENLIPGSFIYVFIRDKINNIFRSYVEVKNDQSFDIVLDDFPISMFTTIFGSVTLIISDDEWNVNSLNIEKNLIPYTCINITAI